jgi:hypothetical protein
MDPISRSPRALHGAFLAIAFIAVGLVLSAPGRAGAFTIKCDWDDDATKNPITLKYYFANSTPDLSVDAQRGELYRAMSLWSKYADITFIPAGGPNETQSIDFGFYSGDHGDGSSNSFDGGGGTLSHAFYPPPFGSETLAGDVHFDEDEDWGASNRSLYSAALHEIGHALGLAHSTDTKSVMYGTFYGGSYGIGLAPDDIAAIRSIYAPKYPALTAHIKGTHEWRSNLAIWIGVAADHSSSPLLEKLVFNHAGGGNTDFEFSEIDLLDFKPYMNDTNDFYVKIVDYLPGATGTLQEFTMSIDGKPFGSSSLTVPLNDATNFTDGVTYYWIDNIPVANTPEPATIGMLGLGAVWLAWGRARLKGRKLRVR